MIDNMSMVPAGAKDVGNRFDNEGAVIADTSGHVNVTGLDSVHIDIDLMLNSGQAFKLTVLFTIHASP